MNIEEATEFLAYRPRTPIDSESLVGFEMISQSIAPTDAFGMIALVGMVRDCEGYYGGRKIAYKVAESPKGTLTLWTLPPEPPTP